MFNTKKVRIKHHFPLDETLFGHHFNLKNRNYAFFYSNSNKQPPVSFFTLICKQQKKQLQIGIKH